MAPARSWWPRQGSETGTIDGLEVKTEPTLRNSNAATPIRNHGPETAELRPPAGINETSAGAPELNTLGVDGAHAEGCSGGARCFTGWTIDRPYQGGGFIFRPWMHDPGAKTVLGQSISAWGGLSDGERVIEILSKHPSTARFVSKKLCMRFVTDDPPSQLVERIAQVFLRPTATSAKCCARSSLL